MHISVSIENPSIYIIIMSCRLHGYPWPSLATSPYHSSPLAGLQGYIPYPHIAAICIFELVGLLLLGHMWRSIGVHHLWAHWVPLSYGLVPHLSKMLSKLPLMSSSLLLQQCPACLVRLTWIVFVMGGRWPYSWCFVGCCRLDLFNITRNILKKKKQYSVTLW